MSLRQEGDGWDAIKTPRAAGLCQRCRKAETTLQVRLFAQERGVNASAGKTKAGRAVRCCDTCGLEVFKATMARMEEVAASEGLPEDRMRAALSYALTYLEADMQGRELNDALDLEILRGGVLSEVVDDEAGLPVEWAGGPPEDKELKF